MDKETPLTKALKEIENNVLQSGKTRFNAELLDKWIVIGILEQFEIDMLNEFENGGGKKTLKNY